MWKGWLSRHLEKSKESGYIHLLFRWKLRVSSQDWPTSGRIINVLDLTWSAGAIPTPCWPPLMAVTAFLLLVFVPLSSLFTWRWGSPSMCLPTDSVWGQTGASSPAHCTHRGTNLLQLSDLIMNNTNIVYIHGLSFNWSNKRKVWQRHWKNCGLIHLSYT